MTVTLKTKAISIKLRATEEATTGKMVMVPINLRIGQHKVDPSRIFKLTITKFNMINMGMLVIRIKIDFKITLINSSSTRSSLLLTTITPKLFMKMRVLEEQSPPTLV
jgi:hypothetical protein